MNIDGKSVVRAEIYNVVVKLKPENQETSYYGGGVEYSYERGENKYTLNNINTHIDRKWEEHSFFSEKKVNTSKFKVQNGYILEESLIIEGYFDRETRVALKTQLEEIKRSLGRNFKISEVTGEVKNFKNTKTGDVVTETLQTAGNFVSKWNNKNIPRTMTRNIEIIITENGKEYTAENVMVLLNSYNEISEKETEDNGNTTENKMNSDKIFSRLIYRVINKSFIA